MSWGIGEFIFAHCSSIHCVDLTKIGGPKSRNSYPWEQIRWSNSRCENTQRHLSGVEDVERCAEYREAWAWAWGLYTCTLALQGTVTEMDKNNPNEMIVGVWIHVYAKLTTQMGCKYTVELNYCINFTLLLQIGRLFGGLLLMRKGCVGRKEVERRGRARTQWKFNTFNSCLLREDYGLHVHFMCILRSLGVVNKVKVTV